MQFLIRIKTYEIKIKQPELTFLGVYDQPDLLRFTYYFIRKTIIEFKSLKMYLQQYRDLIISYERLINVLYDDLLKVYEPKRLRIVLDCNPRGGISLDSLKTLTGIFGRKRGV